MIKINNEFTFGDDVLKSFEKKFPSNTTLFEVLIDCCRLFKCSPTDVMLRENSIKGRIVPLKNNGMILGDLKIGGVQLYATKSFRNRLQRYPILKNDAEGNPELT